MSVTLTFTGPTATSSVSASNSVGMLIIIDFLAAYGIDTSSMMDQEITDAFVQQLKTFIVRTAKGKAVDLAGATASDDAEAAYPDWED